MIIEGTVEHGKRLGHALGFPTVNVRPVRVDGDWPKNGVYAAAVWIGDDKAAWPAMLNQGVHPTAPEGKPTIEAHLLGFDGELYGEPVRVEYLRFLRPERRFESLDALRAQLARDRESVREWLDAAPDADEPDLPQRRARAICWQEA